MARFPSSTRAGIRCGPRPGRLLPWSGPRQEARGADWRGDVEPRCDRHAGSEPGGLLNTLEENQIRRVPVFDQAGTCCGMVSQGDTAQHAPEHETAQVVREVSNANLEPSRAGCCQAKPNGISIGCNLYALIRSDRPQHGYPLVAAAVLEGYVEPWCFA